MSLTVCATPIGNLDDVSLRVLNELAAADLVVCEDTRRTRILLARHGLSRPLLSMDRRRERERASELLGRLERGVRVALVSDAGLPAVNDPGARLIAAAIEAGVPVTVVPGPSAVETALVASGLVGERYTFVGFVPRGDGDRRRLWDEISRWAWPVVAFESPRRLPVTLASLAEADSERPAAVCRELTKRFEEVVRGTASELAARFVEAPRGEVTLVIGAAPKPAPRAVDLDAAVATVQELVRAGAARRPAASAVSRLTGVPANELYRASL